MRRRRRVDADASHRRALVLGVLFALLAGDGLDAGEAPELAVDARDAFDLALGREALVETFVPERLASPASRRASRRSQRFCRPSTGSASTCARSAQTRSIALMVTGLVTM